MPKTSMLACLLLATASTLLVSTSVAWANPELELASRCVQVTGEKRGNHCGEAESHSFNYKNICNETIDIQVCIRKIKGNWDCGSYSGAKQGDESTAFTCRSTGEKWIAAVPSDSKGRRPSPWDGYAMGTGEGRDDTCKRAQDAGANKSPCDCFPVAKDSTKFRCYVLSNKTESDSLINKAKQHVREKLQEELDAIRKRCSSNPDASECSRLRKSTNGGPGIRGDAKPVGSSDGKKVF